MLFAHIRHIKYDIFLVVHRNRKIEKISEKNLSNNKIEKNLLKKNKPILDSVPEKKIDTKDKKNNDKGQDLENETSVDIENTSNLSVKEVIGEGEGKKPTNVKDTDN